VNFEIRRKKREEKKKEVVNNKPLSQPPHTPPHMEGGVVTLQMSSQKSVFHHWTSHQTSFEERRGAPHARICIFFNNIIYLSKYQTTPKPTW